MILVFLYQRKSRNLSIFLAVIDVTVNCGVKCLLPAGKLKTFRGIIFSRHLVETVFCFIAPISVYRFCCRSLNPVFSLTNDKLYSNSIAMVGVHQLNI